MTTTKDWKRWSMTFGAEDSVQIIWNSTEGLIDLYINRGDDSLGIRLDQFEGDAIASNLFKACCPPDAA